MQKAGKKLVSWIAVAAMLLTMFSVSGLALFTTAAVGDVLYSENFNSYSNGTLPSNWTISSDSGITDISVQGGGLVINGLGTDSQTRVFYTGSELQNKGNYIFEADYTILQSDYDLSVSSRFSGMIFRANASLQPYYYVTTRVRTTTTQNEFSIRNSGSSFKKIDNANAPADQALNTTYHLKVVCSGANVKFYIDNALVFNTVLDTTGSAYSYLSTGSIGFTTSNLKIKLDNIVVTETDAATEIQPATYNTYVPATEIINPPSVVANVTDSAVFGKLTGTKLPATSLYYLNSALNITTPDGKTVLASFKEALSNTAGKVIPALYVKDTATVDALTKLATEIALQDAFIVADDPALLKYARQKNTKLFGVLYTKLHTAASREDLANMVATTNASLGKVVMVDANYVSKDDVAYMQQRLMNVWVIGDMDTAAIYTNLSKGVNGIVNTIPGETIRVLETFNSGTPVLVREPFMYAHRGYSAAAPQNTMPAFYEAINYGADLIEMDVRLTSDGVPVLYHDEYLYTLTDCTDETKKVENVTFAELMTYNVDCMAGFSEKIATLEQFLTMIDETEDVVGIIEIKNYDYNLVKASADKVREMGIEDKVVSICFGQGYAAYMRELLPEVSVGWLANPVSTLTTAEDIITYAKGFIMAANMTYHPNYTQIQNYSTNAMVKDAITKAAQRGMSYQPWTYNDHTAFDTAYINGIQGLTTDHLEFDDGYVRKITAGVRYGFKEGQATEVKALGYTSLGHGLYNCRVVRTGGANITFSYSNGKVTASGTGTAYGYLLHEVKTAKAGNYYVMSAMTAFNVSSAGSSTLKAPHHTSLLPSYLGKWRDDISGMNIDVSRTSRGDVFLNTTGSWPSVSSGCGLYASLDDKIYYDMTVGAYASIIITLSDGTSYELQKFMDGVSLQGDDLVGNGASFSGYIKLSDMIPASSANNNEIIISSLRIFNVGDAGTEVVIRNLDLVEDVPAYYFGLGDVDENGEVSTLDARKLLYSVIGLEGITSRQAISADINLDGKVTSADARKILMQIVNQ